MRLLLAILISMFLLGGTFAYTRFAASVRRTAVDYEVEMASDVYSIEIRRTFTAVADSQPDPIWARETRPALEVRFKGQPLLVRENLAPASEEIRIDAIPAVEIGLNEIYVSANRALPPADSIASTSELAAMQVSIKQGDIMIAEATFSSTPGSPLIFGVLLFEGSPPPLETKADH